MALKEVDWEEAKKLLEGAIAFPAETVR